MNRRTVAAALVSLAVLTSCGDAIPLVGGSDEPREFVGYRRDPAPNLADLSLPDVSDGGDEFALRADPGELLVVYFGYTNCPDFCPTTLSDVRLALRSMEPDDAEQIDVAMITVDPERDLPVLADYVGGFFDDGHALGSDDPSALARVAAPFGVQYEVVTNDDGEIEVAHTTQLYALDDEGDLAMTWQFGVTKDDLAADFEQLLDEQATAT